MFPVYSKHVFFWLMDLFQNERKIMSCLPKSAWYQTRTRRSVSSPTKIFLEFPMTWLLFWLLICQPLQQHECICISDFKDERRAIWWKLYISVFPMKSFFLDLNDLSSLNEICVPIMLYISLWCVTFLVDGLFE